MAKSQPNDNTDKATLMEKKEKKNGAVTKTKTATP